MNEKRDLQLVQTRSQGRNRSLQTIFSILLSLLLFFSIFPGIVYAERSNGDDGGLGWILFYVTLVILIVIIILWVITYVIMRGVINRITGDRNKLRRYESRKEGDMDRREREKERYRGRRARAPSGNCLACKRKFIPGSDAYQCDCGKFIHVHCIADMSLCPHCGREIEKDVGIVRLEDAGRERGAVGAITRTKINRLIKAKFCPVCNKIIKAGDSAIECECGAMFHIKCSDKARVCPKCGL